MRRRGRRWIKLIAILATLSWIIWADASARSRGFSAGPPAGFTGAPGEDTCEQCHDDFEVNRGNGSVSISGLPSVYHLEQRITMVVNVQKPGQGRWGFQLTALTVDGAPVGQFVITDEAHTQLVNGTAGRVYVEHTNDGTYAGAQQGASWSFDWIAPAKDSGSVAFYAAANAANNDAERTGDYIYTTSQIILPPSFPEVRLLSPNGGEVVGTGEVFEVQWESSSNVTGFTLLLLPREGSTPGPIVSGLPAASRSYEWRVPLDLVTSSARILIVAFNDFGSNADDSDRPFLVVDRTPPQVQLRKPADGDTVLVGATLRVEWTAVDNIGVVSQDVLISPDGGVNFIPLAEGTRPEVRTFDWNVPPDFVSDRAKIRIVARDQAGNVGSATNGAPFFIRRPIMPGDVDEDGRLTFHDLLLLLGIILGLVRPNPAADVNGDGRVDFLDLLRLLALLLGLIGQ